MRTFVKLLLTIVALMFMMLLLQNCSAQEPELKHNMKFEAVAIQNFMLYIDGEFFPETEIEVWATHQQDSLSAMPIMFLKLDSKTELFQNYRTVNIRTPYIDSFHYGLVTGKFIWFQIRLKDRRGYSYFKTYYMKVNQKIKGVI